MEKQTKIQIYVLLIGVLIGAGVSLTNSLILWNNSLNKEKSDIAEGLYLDVSSLQDTLVLADKEFQSGDTCDDDIFVQSAPLYPVNGLYYSYQRDIPKMNRKIAQDTFAFYSHLLSAERDRSLIFDIQQQGDVRNLTPAEIRRQEVLTENIAREVNISVSLLPSLRQELDSATAYESLIY
jgi:hypothetical protein